jgi:hypothetical protein
MSEWEIEDMIEAGLETNLAEIPCGDEDDLMLAVRRGYGRSVGNTKYEDEELAQ